MAFNTMFHEICDIIRNGKFAETHLTVNGKFAETHLTVNGKKCNFIFIIKTDNHSNFYNAGIPNDVGVRFICGNGNINIKIIGNYGNDAKNFISEKYTFDQLIKEMKESSFDINKFEVSNIHINDN